jgi:hypothetical protein
MIKLPSAPLPRRRGGISGPESRCQGCVFDDEFDVLKDAICGASHLSFAYQRPAQTHVRNFSLPSYCNRLAPNPEDRAALVRDNENHDRNPPVLKDLPPMPKDLAVDEPSRRKYPSPFAYLGPDNQLHQIPPIVLTEGQDEVSHVSQFQEKLRARPLGMFPPSISELHDIVMSSSARCRP